MARDRSQFLPPDCKKWVGLQIPMDQSHTHLRRQPPGRILSGFPMHASGYPTCYQGLCPVRDRLHAYSQDIVFTLSVWSQSANNPYAVVFGPGSDSTIPNPGRELVSN